MAGEMIMNDKRIYKQIIKFALVGGTAFIIDYFLLYFCTSFLKIPYYFSNIVSFSVSVIYNYILSYKWVFEVDEEQNKKMGFLIFIVLSVIGLILNQLILWITVEYFNIYYMTAKVGATGIVMIYNFVSRKILLER